MSASRAWREPMVWLMLAIPFATVVAGMQTLRVARAGGMDAEPEPVLRTGQTQVVDLGADRRAAALGLVATLRVDARGVPGIAVDAAGPLELTLVHPTRTAGDLRWIRDGDGAWSGPPLPRDARGRWVLEPATHDWRLVGRWPAADGIASLQPAVAER
jgi:hypothetical protein